MKTEAVKTMIALSTSAFGMVAALAWNSAITELFRKIFGQASGIISLFTYAIVVTVVAVWVTSRLGKLAQRLEDKNKISTK